MFEVDHLEAVSPAIVSRCGIVYVDAAVMSWRYYIKKWAHTLFVDREIDDVLKRELRRHIVVLLEDYCEQGIRFLENLGPQSQYIQTSSFGIVQSICNILAALLDVPCGFEFGAAPVDKLLINKLFVYSFVSSFGAVLADQLSRSEFDLFAREIFEKIPDAEIPADAASVYNIFVDVKSTRYALWDPLVPSAHYDPQTHFSGTMIATVDTIAAEYLFRLLASAGAPVLVTGISGVGKTLIIESAIKSMDESWVASVFPLAPHTIPSRIQRLVESKLKADTVTHELRVNQSKKLVVFLDDLNVPLPDQFGTQVTFRNFIYIHCSS